MLDFGTDTPKLRLILSGFRGQLAPFITVHSPDSTKSGRCPYLASKFAGMPRFMGPIRAIEGERGRKQHQNSGASLILPSDLQEHRRQTVWAAWSGHGSGNLRFGITLQMKFIINLFNSNFYDKYLYGRARMKSAHGTAENIGRSITTNGEAVQSAVARWLTGRSGGLSVITDFQAHAAKLPRQAGAALFECRR